MLKRVSVLITSVIYQDLKARGENPRLIEKLALQAKERDDLGSD